MSNASVSRLVLVLALAGSLRAQIVFSDQTAAAGLTAAVHNPTYGASYAAGGAVGDFNGDGLQDIFHPAGGGSPDKLFINQGNGSFVDMAAAWGVALSHRSTAAAVGDFDGDGWLDIYVTSLGTAAADMPGQNKLYRNLAGTGFVDVAAAMGVATTSTTGGDGWGAAFGDYDLDGDLDLLVAGFQTQTNKLFRNDGTTFTDVTAAAGMSIIQGVWGFTPRFVDLDLDGDQDIVLIGDFMTSRYFRNNGNGTFTDLTASSGTNTDGTEMGMAVADFDEDGDLDLYVTTISTNNLYVNQGNHTYTNAAASAGVVNTGWGWGTVAVDADLDGRIDLFATSQSGAQFAFRNTATTAGTLSFADVSATSGFVSAVSGRGLSALDYDNDGDMDLVVFPSSGPVKLFRNDRVPGPNNHWLRVFLSRGTNLTIAPDGVGAVVRVLFNGRTLMRTIDAGSNYLSNSELSAHFGLGSATTVTLQVDWPDGQITVMNNVAVDQTLTVVQASVPGQPYLSSISPSSTEEDLPVTLSLTGTQFAATAVVTVDGIAVPTTVLSSVQMTAQVPASAVANPGTAAVAVFDPVSGLTSPPRNLAVTGPKLGAAASGLSIYRINGSSGGTDRRVDVLPGGSVTLTMNQPVATAAPANWLLWGVLGVPDPAYSFTAPGVTGDMCFPPCEALPGHPLLFTIVNTFGPGGCPPLATAGPTPASLSFLAPPFPLTIATQGAVQFTIGTNTIAAFTNGILLDID